MSELESVVQRNATRYPNRSRNEVGMMSAEGRWVATIMMIPAARPRATRSRTRVLNSSCWSLVPVVTEKNATSSITQTMTSNPSAGIDLAAALRPTAGRSGVSISACRARRRSLA